MAAQGAGARRLPSCGPFRVNANSNLPDRKGDGGRGEDCAMASSQSGVPMWPLGCSWIPTTHPTTRARGASTVGATDRAGVASPQSIGVWSSPATVESAPSLLPPLLEKPGGSRRRALSGLVPWPAHAPPLRHRCGCARGPTPAGRRWRTTPMAVPRQRCCSALVPVALLAVPRPPLPMTPTQAAGPDWCWPTCGQVPVPPAGSV